MIAACCAAIAVIFAMSAIRRESNRSIAQLARLSTLDLAEFGGVSGLDSPLIWRLARLLLLPISARLNPKFNSHTSSDLIRAGLDITRFGTLDVMALKVVCSAAMFGLALLL